MNLNIIEIFSSIQGETSFTGLPTSFVRLAACNLRCSWCDTPYSFGRGEPIPLNEILKTIDQFGNLYVCITGGEPLLQNNVLSLMSQLCDLNYRVSIETGGSLPTDEIDLRVKTILDIKCPGSGMEDKNLWSNLNHLRLNDEVKFVILNREDYEFAKKICDRYQLFQREIPPLFSPVHQEMEAKELVEWILNDQIPVRLNLQIHKFVWEPHTMGV